MCGRLNVTDDQYVKVLVEQLGLDLNITPIQPNRFVRAADQIQIITERYGQRQLETATWWLLLEQSETGFKPSKYTSFNTRYDKLNVPRSAGYTPFRQSRCLIVAKGFGETEFEYQGKRKVPKHYFDFEAIDSALVFGGLYRDYVHRETGEITTGCSIITLPPHPSIAPYHSKASPMMLPHDDVLNAWLDSRFQQLELFNPYLQPRLYQDLLATQINKPSLYQPIAEPIVIGADR